MSDRFYVTMSIGGMTTRDKFSELYGQIEASGLDDGDHRSIGNEKDLEECVESGRTLGLAHDQSRYDAIDDLKCFCQDNNLSYLIRWESSGEYEAEVQFWIPGMTLEYEKCITSNGYDYIHGETIRAILEAYSDPVVALDRIKANLPRGEPNIPPFYVVNTDSLGGKIIEAELLFEATMAA